MFVFGNLLDGIVTIFNWLLTVYMWMIIIRALLSWVNPDPWNPIVQFLTRVTEPVLAPIRRRLPTWQMGIDLSPMVVILIIWLVQIGIVPSLYRLALEMR
jgi:YggT family protein